MVTGICYLGLTFDQHLRWNLHVNNLVMNLCILSLRYYKLQNIVPMLFNSKEEILLLMF